jgi:hypothetical protein
MHCSLRDYHSSLGYQKFWTRWIPKMLTGAHETKRMASALTFSEWYHKNGDEFLSHIVRVTGNETWVSFVNFETKEQSNSEYTHIHQKRRKSLNRRRLPATKLFWDMKGALMVEFSSSPSYFPWTSWLVCEIWGFHGSDYEECRLLGCGAVYILCEPTFRRNVSPPSCG